MTNSASFTDEDIDRLTQLDLRRTTLLAAWTITLLYVLSDLMLRMGIAARIPLVERIGGWITSAVWLQILAFIIGMPLVWLLCFLADLGIVSNGRRSWLYRLGNLVHGRPFLLAYLASLVLIGMLALQYDITYSSFWLIFVVLLVSCLVGFIEPGGAWRSTASESWARLTLLLVRIPGIRRFVSLGQVNARLAQGTATNIADEEPAQAPAASAVPGSDPEQNPRI